jgi:hypothetical protein
MDLRLPPDVSVNARLLQVHDFTLGKMKQGRGDIPWTTLRVTVLWIEQFGILHMVWGIENGAALRMDDSKIPKRRIEFADDVSEAGRMAIAWVEELVKQVEGYIDRLEPECPIAWADFWVKRAWPK